MVASWEEGCSSSSISIPKLPKWEYDVFVSFRGADTRKKFTSHLLAALEDNGFCTFRDDKELERGEYISDGLVKAIEASRMSLIVFSKDYAGSRWCLDELVRIMDCKKTSNQIVVPIFLDVDPSDVGKQDLQKAFAKHKKRSREEPDGKVEKWRAALTEAAKVAGHHLPNDSNGDEAAFIEKIIKDVREKVPIHLGEPDHQVGLERHVEKLIDLLKMEFIGVRFVAIWGMGGIGKTTTAIKLYNRIQHEFKRSGFLADVRDTLQRNGREELQNRLLLELLRRTDKVSNFLKGIGVIKKTAFGPEKVLLVLDDVDDVEQLETLAINRDFFAPGSRIIITTRDRSLLKNLKLGEDEIYELKELDKDESLELFRRHAFKFDHPPKDLLDRSRQIAHFAGGLPLALEVLGSYFRKIPQCQWERSIAKLRKIPRDDVRGRLKISYNSLSKELQKLFLDMACFFVRMDRDFTVKILEGCEAYDILAEDGIRELADRCLLKFDFSGKIVMHDMIGEMGREIVKQEPPEDPGKRSRLLYPDVLEVLRDGTGTEAVKGLILNGREVQVNANPLEKKMDKPWYRKHVLEVWRDFMGTEVVEDHLSNCYDPKYVQVHAKAFEKMSNLWLLHLDYIHLSPNNLATGYEHIFKRLLWLSWKGFPLHCIPRNFSMEKLVALDLCYSSLKKVWNGKMILPKLKFLYLSHCHYLTKTPDFSGLCSLEELLLNDCKSLVEVDESIRCLNNLLVLDMENCTELRKFPSGILMLKSLKHLDLSGCSKLGRLTVFKGPLGRLAVFFSSWTLPPNGVNSIGFPLAPIPASSCLTCLNLGDCKFSKLPDEIENLISLRNLNLEKNNLSILPDGIANLTCLELLNLSNNNLSDLPSGIGRLTSLKRLKLESNSLRALPDTIGKLSALESLNLEENSLRTLPDTIGKLSSLNSLYLDYNNLSDLPIGIGDLDSLFELWLDNCENLRSLPKLPRHTYVSLEGCPSLESVPLELDQLGMVVNNSESIKLAEKNFLTSLLKQLPKSKGLSEVQHVVSVIVPPGDQDRSQFPDHDRGPNVCFEVPPSPSVKQKMLGWILRLLVNWPAEYQNWPAKDQYAFLTIKEVVCNKIKKEIIKEVGIYNYHNNKCSVDHVWFLYIPQGYNGLQLEAGNEVEISMYENYGTYITNKLMESGDPITQLGKSWAIDFIYETDKIHKGSDTFYQVVTI